MTQDHNTIQRWLAMRSDKALTTAQEAALAQHLAQCEVCRDYAASIDRLNLVLDDALQERAAVTVSAETHRKQRQLKQALSQPRPRPRLPRQLPAFATGVIALFLMFTVVLRTPLLGELRATAVPTTAALLVAEDSDGTPAVTPTQPASATEPPLPTALPPATMTPLPTAVSADADSNNVNVVDALVDDAPVLVTAVLTATPTASPTVQPPTATATAPVLPDPTATQTAPQLPSPTATARPTNTPTPTAPPDPTSTPLPTATPTPLPSPTPQPTATISSESEQAIVPAVAQRTARVLTSGTAAEIRAQFADEVVYAARGIGYNYLTIDEFVPEMQRFQTFSTQYDFSDCSYPITRRDVDQVNCTLIMQNDWRRALGFEPYIAVAFLLYEPKTERITEFIAFQHTGQAMGEQQQIQRLINWYNANHDGDPLSYFIDASNRIVNSAELYQAVPAWIAAGRP